MEFTRRFLLKNKLPIDLMKVKSNEYKIYYLSHDPKVRITQLDDIYLMAYKSSGNLVRFEEEFYLLPEDFIKLRDRDCINKSYLHKRKYRFTDEYGNQVDLNTYLGSLIGLDILEIKFKSTEIADAYLVPDWLGEEVTYNPNYRDKNLVKLSQPHLLESFSSDRRL